MANLSSALNYALAGLTVSAAQSAVVSRNVSQAGDENYTRKTAEIVTLPNGAPVASQITRSTDRQLLDKLLTSTSASASQQITSDALTRMSALTGDPEKDQSITASLGKLQVALRNYEQNPGSPALGGAAFQAARAVTQKLNDSSLDVSSLRIEADRGIAESAGRINNLLAQFKVVNDSIVRGQGTAGDLSDALDQRDSILKHLSEEIGIRTVARPNNDLLIYADGGAVLFEGGPRQVSFSTSPALQPADVGSALTIDGVAVTGLGSPMPITGGKAAALARVRDNLAPQLSLQLEQIAAGLIRAFSETAPQLPTVEGLFRGDGTIPLLNGENAGLAAQISINSLADPDQGGSVLMIRDGGFGGSPYLRNVAGQAGYQVRLAELADAVDLPQAFGISGGIGGSASLKDFSMKSASWIDEKRQSAQSTLDVANATKSRAANSLTQVSGVSIDQEMATLLDLEKSYQASSKVLAIVNSLLGSLLEAVG